MNTTNKVLLLDDNAHCNFIMREFVHLHDDSIQVVECQSTQDAIAHLSTTQNFPEIIFVDINMPVEDGFAFVEQYEKLFMRSQHVAKVYMLSSSARFEDQNRACAFECVDGFISKSEVFDKIDSLLAVPEKLDAA